MASKCEYFYRLRDQGLVATARKWLKNNPPPAKWKHSAWRWAHENMDR